MLGKLQFIKKTVDIFTPLIYNKNVIKYNINGGVEFDNIRRRKE